MKRLWSWYKGKLGIIGLEKKTIQSANRLSLIENLVRVGVDLNFSSPSWIVVCLRGKNEQDVVRFFELPEGQVGRLLEELKYLEKQYYNKPIFDAPRYIKKEMWRL